LSRLLRDAGIGGAPFEDRSFGDKKSVPTISKSAADRLGETIKSEGFSEQTLIQLDAYRLQFGAAYDFVVGRLRELGYEPTGRPAKSSRAILDKLRRESIRLSQIQDIAGCRIVVNGMTSQDEARDKLIKSFSTVQVVDRRSKPSHSYRAVHVVVESHALKVEIQVRTDHQQQWAELSEKLADRFGLEVKYGQGPKNVRDALSASSEYVAALERSELAIRNLESAIERVESVDPRVRRFLVDQQAFRLEGRRELAEALAEINRLFEES
jgi:ppGpp synthetase/RelA/SpoT-type nucleotidyltranferase